MTIDITKLTTDGRGLAFVEGKATFVKNALPGEVVHLNYLKRKRQYDEAVTTEIVQASPERVVPQCQVFGICGGCSLQHLETSAQIQYKETWLREMLERVNLPVQTWMSPLQAQVWGYRNKARLGVRFVNKKNETLVGFREAMSNFITNTQRCEILHPGIGEHLEVLKRVLTTLEIKCEIAQIEVAVADQGVGLVFRNLVPMPDQDLAKIIELAKQFSWIVYLQPGGYETVQQVYPVEFMTLSYGLPKYNLRFQFRPQDFTQVNGSLNEMMVAQALDWLDVHDHERVLDLFCGLGNFTLPITRFAQEVIGVEGDAGMTQLALNNAKLNDISNVQFHAANLFEEAGLKVISGSVDKVLLDPPRAGAEMVARNMHLWKPKRIVYVSCHPATLVRDLEILVKEQGYRLDKMGVMDMFPHTNHVEAMALLVASSSS